MDCSTPGFLVLHYLLEFVQTHVYWVSDAIPPSHLLSPSSPPASVFSNETAFHIRWPKYWSFSFSTCLSNEYSGLISFRMDRFDLLAVQGSLKGLLQHYSSKASILQGSAFFMVHSHIHTWLLEKPKLWLDRPCQQSNVSAFYRETCISLPSNPPSSSQTGCSLRLKYNGITLLQWLHVTHG